jgi:hypothetical protein
LEGQFLAHGGKFPSTLVPCLVATAPPFDSFTFHVFPTPLADITLLTTTISTILVFFVWDRYNAVDYTVHNDNIFALNLTLCVGRGQHLIIYGTYRPRCISMNIFFKCIYIDKYKNIHTVNTDKMFIYIYGTAALINTECRMPGVLYRVRKMIGLVMKCWSYNHISAGVNVAAKKRQYLLTGLSVVLLLSCLSSRVGRAASWAVC